MKKISQNTRLLYKAVMEYAELLLDPLYFDNASKYVSAATRDEDAFKAVCADAGIPEQIPGLSQNLREYLFDCAIEIPPINMMW